MKINGANTIAFPVAAVWDALLDPAVLVRTIPGCERLAETGEDAYAMTVTAGVAAIKGTYDGTCTLSDLELHRSLTMRLQGAGAPGTVDATVAVSFEDLADGGTRVTWDADAVVGGMVGGVGQRMLGSVSKRMAGEFFDNVGRSLVEPVETTSTRHKLSDGSPTSTVTRREVSDGSRVWGSPAAGNDFVRGIAVGAGLVLLGVVAGSVLGRRR